MLMGGKFSSGSHGQELDENNPGIGLDDDIISNLVPTHQAYESVTQVNTKKAAIQN